jgi:small subunit ribosomal protein S6
MKKRTYTYEAMFMISQATASQLNEAIAHINEILARGNAQLIAMRKWDERRLAYEIAGQKRAVYILAYFKAPGPDVAHIERDCNLSERVMRAMILRADHLTEEEILALDARKELETEARLRADRAVVPAAAAKADEPKADEAEEDAEPTDE